MSDTNPIPFNELGAIAAVCGLLVFVVRWLLGNFVDRLKAIENAIEQVNDAVNHTHEKHGPHAPKLYDVALHNNEMVSSLQKEVADLTAWRDGYMGGPLDSGQKVMDFCELCAARFAKIDGKLDEVVLEIQRVGCPHILTDGRPLCEESRKPPEPPSGSVPD